MIVQTAGGNEIELACLRKDVEDWKRRALAAESELAKLTHKKSHLGCPSCEGLGFVEAEGHGYTCERCGGYGSIRG